ncbi:diacylglycerol kinase family protein [Micromonospora aurantiaca]|uniref:diacylglycerol kinase family protein n=1 Tax=Micromonospora aurantiaca (nom. illeg.) TaxID=47850 RepID=UPI00340A6E04
MYDVVLLTLGSERDAPGGGCGSGGACCGGADDTAAESGEERCETPRVPVLVCADELTARGARVTTVTARSDSEIDEVLARLDGPPRADGLTWPDSDGKTRLIVATASDGQLRAVLRRLVRRYAPPPSRRPADLAANRTVPDLPPVGVLPLDPARSGTARDLAAQLGLPRDPAGVALAVLDGTARRLDLLRNDGGSVTLDGALLGAADDAGRPLHWRARVEVDGTVLSDGSEPITACAIGNAGGYARLGEVDLLGGPDPADGRVTVGVAVPVVTRSALGRKKVRLEVRRARGRAVAVVPRDEKVPFLDDGVEGELSRKRSWWTEPGAWAVWTG